MRDSAVPIMCAIFCIYPLLFWAIPAFVIGRYKPRLRSPIALQYEDRTGPTAVKPGSSTSSAMLRRIVQDRDNVGFKGQ